MYGKKTLWFVAGIGLFGALAAAEFVKFKNAVKKTHEEDEKYW
ncbi:hypothetical protein [Metabacillus sp. RGM 3146]